MKATFEQKITEAITFRKKDRLAHAKLITEAIADETFFGGEDFDYWFNYWFNDDVKEKVLITAFKTGHLDISLEFSEKGKVFISSDPMSICASLYEEYIEDINLVSFIDKIDEAVFDRMVSEDEL